MVDIVSAETRARMMKNIRGKNTKPEMVIRRALHKIGLRYRLHDKALPGKPDLVFPKYSAVVFMHGCFWHMHDCLLFKMPDARSEFWNIKLTGNRDRDSHQVKKLLSLNWRVCIVWECSIRGALKDVNNVTHTIEEWLKSDTKLLEIRG